MSVYLFLPWYHIYSDTKGRRRRKICLVTYAWAII